MPFLGTMKYFTRSNWAWVFIVIVTYNVKVEQCCWNQPYICLLMWSQWSVLNIRCCSHYFSPSFSCLTAREKCLPGVSDARLAHAISCQLLTCWFLEVTCSATAVQLPLSGGDPGHMSRRSSSTRTGEHAVSHCFTFSWSGELFLFFFWHQAKAR